jgi:GNAT superfamily N-acetyltransferase
VIERILRHAADVGVIIARIKTLALCGWRNRGGRWCGSRVNRSVLLRTKLQVGGARTHCGAVAGCCAAEMVEDLKVSGQYHVHPRFKKKRLGHTVLPALLMARRRWRQGRRWWPLLPNLGYVRLFLRYVCSLWQDQGWRQHSNIDLLSCVCVTKLLRDEYRSLFAWWDCSRKARHVVVASLHRRPRDCKRTVDITLRAKSTLQ